MVTVRGVTFCSVATHGPWSRGRRHGGRGLNSGQGLTIPCSCLHTAVDDCEPRINNVGSGAINVGRRPQLESMIVGQNGCSIASPASN